MNKYIIASIIFSACSITNASDLQIDPENGRVFLGTIQQGKLNDISRTDVSSNVWYERGIYNQVDFGYSYSKETFGQQYEGKFKAFSFNVFQVTEVDLTRVINQLDPDGEYANGCEYMGIKNNQHVVRNSNHWCDPEFTLSKAFGFYSAEPVTTSNPLLTGTRIEDRLTLPASTFDEIKLDMPGFGKFQGYINEKDFAFAPVYLTLSPQPVPISEMANIAVNLIEGSKFGYLTSHHYASYAGFPRTRSDRSFRSVQFSLVLEKIENGLSRVYLEPDFWDSSLELCEFNVHSELKCNKGYKGSVVINIPIQGIPRNISFN